ncbi:MAG: HPr family phosphocarrier protein [Chitinispirillaceae bacterium]|jgi:phosphocarrier protein
MRTKKVTVRTKNGLHMRVAGRIIDKSNNSLSKIVIRKGQSSADARSIIDLLMLAATEGSEIEIVVDGGDEEKTLREVEAVLIDGAGI